MSTPQQKCVRTAHSKKKGNRVVKPIPKMPAVATGYIISPDATPAGDCNTSQVQSFSTRTPQQKRSAHDEFSAARESDHNVNRDCSESYEQCHEDDHELSFLSSNSFPSESPANSPMRGNRARSFTSSPVFADPFKPKPRHSFSSPRRHSHNIYPMSIGNPTQPGIGFTGGARAFQKVTRSRSVTGLLSAFDPVLTADTSTAPKTRWNSSWANMERDSAMVSSDPQLYTEIDARPMLHRQCDNQFLDLDESLQSDADSPVRHQSSTAMSPLTSKSSPSSRSSSSSVFTPPHNPHKHQDAGSTRSTPSRHRNNEGGQQPATVTFIPSSIPSSSSSVMDTTVSSCGSSVLAADQEVTETNKSELLRRKQQKKDRRKLVHSFNNLTTKDSNIITNNEDHETQTQISNASSAQSSSSASTHAYLALMVARAKTSGHHARDGANVAFDRWLQSAKRPTSRSPGSSTTRNTSTSRNSFRRSSCDSRTNSISGDRHYGIGKEESGSSSGRRRRNILNHDPPVSVSVPGNMPCETKVIASLVSPENNKWNDLHHIDDRTKRMGEHFFSNMVGKEGNVVSPDQTEPVIVHSSDSQIRFSKGTELFGGS